MSNLYSEGSVWRISFVKVPAGKGDAYLSEVGLKRKKILDEAIRKGYIISYKTLNGLAMGKDDWDFMFMVEYKNWGSIDEMRKKMDTLNQEIIGTEEKVVALVESRQTERDVIGEKFMRELHFN